MKQGQRLTENGHDVALFPMQFLRITQPPMKVGETHEGTMNIDLAGIDSGKSDFYAPFSMKVVKNSNTNNHEIIWWSTDLVKCADGSLSLLSMRTLHDDDVSDLPVGKVFAQGELCTQEGNTGNSHGNHVHMCVAKGHTTKISVKASGYRDLVGSVNPQDVFFVNDTVIGNTMGMTFKYYQEPEPKYASMIDCDKQFQTGKDNIRIRKLPTIYSDIIGLLPSNNLYDITQVSANKCDNYDWVKLTHLGITGYCAVIDTSIVLDKVTEPVIVTLPIVTPEPIEEPDIVIPVIVEPEPIIEPTPIEVEVHITNTNETQTTHHEPVNALYKIIIAIIELILKLIKGK